MSQSSNQAESQNQADEIRQNVRESYAQVAEASNQGNSCGEGASCCGITDDAAINALVSTRFGYTEDDLENVPEGAGFDCFLAAAETGESGQVIGIDMTPTMISKARNNAVKGKYDHVEFRLGEIEHMPVANDTVDVIISNCVINLSPDKKQVFSEAFRVLKPGGRLAISDIVTSTELPEEMRNDLALYSGCMAGASIISELQNILEQSGFEQIKIAPKDESKDFIKDWAPGRGVEDYVLSATIEAVKPGGGCSGGGCC